MNRKTADIIGWVAFIKIYVLVWRGVLWGVTWSAPLSSMFTWTSTLLKEISKSSTKWLDQQGNCSWTWLSFLFCLCVSRHQITKKSEFEMCGFYFFLRRKKTIEIQQIKSEEWMNEIWTEGANESLTKELCNSATVHVQAWACLCAKRKCLLACTHPHTDTHR